MHSKDRTMLAAFGFKDADKRDRRHDLACQYVAQREVAAKLMSAEPQGKFHCVFEAEIRRTNFERSRLLKPLIGFLDVLLMFGEQPLAVEVKIATVTVGDIIRQVRFYRQADGDRDEYAAVGDIVLEHVPFVVATAFDLSEGDAKMLFNEGIGHVVLGAGFAKFCEASTAEDKRANSPEI